MTEFQYSDTSSWQAWQVDYRYGAFYIFPPAGVIEAVDELRETYDPTSAGYCQAHISLSEPLQHPLTQTELDDLTTRLAAIEPFSIRYGPLRNFPPYPGVTYSITPEEPFRTLRSAIHSASMFRGMTPQREHVAPHMTIAEFISTERTDELLKQLSGNVPEGTFLCDSVEYAVPNRDFYFERVLTIPLGS